MTGQPPVTQVIKSRRLSWLGHVLRMPSDCADEGKRRQGRPTQTIKRLYTADLDSAGLTWEESQLFIYFDHLVDNLLRM